MKTKIIGVGVFICMALAACQAHAQYKMVGGKLYTWNDPGWTDFNCYLEVIQISGNDLICRPYTVASSSSVVTGRRLNERTASVVSESHRVYQRVTFALRNYGLQAVGTSIYPGTRAMQNGTIFVTSAYRTGGAINETKVTSATYPLYDIGLNYTPPVKPLTPEQIKAQDEKKLQAQAKVLKSNQDMADKGDAYGLLRMGERYRDGDGVPKDLMKAREYLTKAAAAGSPTAEDDLKKLLPN